MILYCKDSFNFRLIDNNNIELINIYLYHYVTVTTMCFMIHQRLSRCPQQCIKQGKPTSLYSLGLATSANVIYDVGITRSRRFRIEFGIPNEIIRKYSETAWKFGLCHFLDRKKCGNLNFVIFNVGKSSESWT
jgi:hypothetical protein